MNSKLKGSGTGSFKLEEASGILCTICQTVLEQYGTLEMMQPRNCVRWSYCITQAEATAEAAAEAVQKNIYGCTCRVRTLKNSGRQILYCRCEA